MDPNEAERIAQERKERLARMGLEPEDCYFTEEGYLVFTERYHLKRGYCCGNRCRHCPYGHKAVRKVQG